MGKAVPITEKSDYNTASKIKPGKWQYRQPVTYKR